MLKVLIFFFIFFSCGISADTEHSQAKIVVVSGAHFVTVQDRKGKRRKIEFPANKQLPKRQFSISSNLFYSQVQERPVITKEEFDLLSDDQKKQGIYTQDSDGFYKISVGGYLNDSLLTPKEASEEEIRRIRTFPWSNEEAPSWVSPLVLANQVAIQCISSPPPTLNLENG